MIAAQDILLDEELVEDLQLEASLEDLEKHPLWDREIYTASNMLYRTWSMQHYKLSRVCSITNYPKYAVLPTTQSMQYYLLPRVCRPRVGGSMGSRAWKAPPTRWGCRASSPTRHWTRGLGHTRGTKYMYICTHVQTISLSWRHVSFFPENCCTLLLIIFYAHNFKSKTAFSSKKYKSFIFIRANFTTFWHVKVNNSQQKKPRTVCSAHKKFNAFV